MARTNDGIEFYLVEVSGEPGDMEHLKDALSRAVREGDVVFPFEGRLYLALASDVRGAGHATRRILRVVRDQFNTVRTRLVPEPFEERLWKVASRLVTGELPISPRKASGKQQDRGARQIDERGGEDP